MNLSRSNKIVKLMVSTVVAAQLSTVVSFNTDNEYTFAMNTSLYNRKMISETNQIIRIVKPHFHLEQEGPRAIATLINKEQLYRQLQNSSLRSHTDEIERAVTALNDIMSGAKGQEKKEQLKQIIRTCNDSDAIYFKSDVSKVLGAVGFVHVTSFGAAAVLLGVSGPVGLAVTTAYGAAYTVAGILLD